MSLRDLVSEVHNSFIPSKALYSISTSWSKTALRFNRTNKPTTNSNMKLCKELLNSLTERRGEDGTHIIEVRDLRYSIIAKINTDVKEFLKQNMKSANPRLTGLFKWYRDNTVRRMQADTIFADDMAELYKYLFNRSDILTETDIMNGLGLLKIIYNKYRV